MISIPEDEAPGDEFAEDKDEVAPEFDVPQQSPEAPDAVPNLSAAGPEDAINQSFPHALSSSQDDHPDNPTNSNLTGYQGTQQPSNPNLMGVLNVTHSKRPRKPKIIWDLSDQ